MNFYVKTSQVRGATRLATLLGTASLFTIASVSAAQAAAAPAAPAGEVVSEVTITGSLIAGAPAVGVPVTAVGQEEFDEVAAVTISEMLRQIPAIEGNESVGTVVTSGANRQRLQNAEIHGIGGQSTATLLMVNGHRYPAQGTNLENVDPSMIPQLAIDRIDVLAAGASATYGSDAVAGVINIILKRNYDGAVSLARMGLSTDLGWDSVNFQASQLYGRTWDGGGITLTYEWFDRRDVKGNKTHGGRDYYTVDFEVFGYDDRTPLASNFPGVISTGNPSASGLTYNGNSYGTPPTRTGGQSMAANLGDRFCNNCYVIPQGVGWNYGDQPEGSTVAWSTLLANKLSPTNNNQRSPYEFSNMNPAQQGNFAVLTFDHMLTEDFYGLGSVSLFVDAFYMNRRSQTAYIPGWSPCARCHTTANGVTIPTNNPYRPSGVPSGTTVRSHYSLGKEFIPDSDAGSISAQYSFGLNFDDLPFGWTGSIFHSASEETNWAFTRNMVNVNMFNAALGNTISSQAASGTRPPHAAFTKPASIPYLNTVCDSIVYKCNSPQTLDYIRAARDDYSDYNQREFGVNASGPIYDLPFLGGPILGAVGAQKLTQHFFYINPTSENSFNTEAPEVSRQYNKQLSWAVFGQMNIPIIGERNALPFVQGLLIELGYRYDEYYELGGVKTPKIAGNWDVGYGLTFRGAYGESFNAPPFGLISNYSGVRETHEMYNVPGSRASDLNLTCPAHSGAATPVQAGAVQAGSLQHYLNPLRYGCPANASLSLLLGPTDPGTANNFNKISAPVGIDLGSSIFFLNGAQLQPETSQQWSLGFNFTPMDSYGFVDLTGLSLDVSWWHIQRESLIGTINVGAGVNDDLSFDSAQTGFSNADPFASRYIVAANPALPLSNPANSALKAMVDEIIATGKAAFDPGAIDFIKFVGISSIYNERGWSEISGLDFSVRYDWDMGEWGAFNARMSGYYELRNRNQDGPGDPITSSYTQIQRETGLRDGANSGHQMQRMRFNLGWTDGVWNVTGGATWNPHSFNGSNPPGCFWHPDFAPGSARSLPFHSVNNPTGVGFAGCYPGSPFYPQAPLPAPQPNDLPVTDQRFGGVFAPSQMFFDLAISYDTGLEPANMYLQNLRIGFNINNILNRLPSALDYDARTSSGSPRIRQGNDFQRTVTLSLTKSW